MRIGIVVVTYFPDIAKFKACLKSYIEQVESIVIVDNTESKNIQHEISNLTCNFPKIHLISLDKNVGIAKAQNIGIQYLLMKGFEYFIEIDQDSVLPIDYVDRISFSFAELKIKQKKVAGIGPIAMNNQSGYFYHGIKPGNGILCVSKTLSSGFLISKESFLNVGNKDEKLFIDYVDWEWCWRAKKLGFETFIDSRLVMQHELGNGQLNLFGFNIGIPSPVRHYYQYRNSYYLMCRSYVPIEWKIQRFSINILKFLIILLLPYPIKRIQFIFKAYLDILKRKHGSV